MRVARKLEEAGYVVREVRLEPDGGAVVGEVVAETTAIIGHEPYRFPVVLSMGREEWTYEVESPAKLGDLLRFPPGAILPPEAAREVVVAWWIREACREEVDAWRELVGEGDLSVLPSIEEIEPLLEESRLRREEARAARACGDEVFVIPGQDT
jgi:hypothetical protein